MIFQVSHGNPLVHENKNVYFLYFNHILEPQLYLSIFVFSLHLNLSALSGRQKSIIGKSMWLCNSDSRQTETDYKLHFYMWAE